MQPVDCKNCGAPMQPHTDGRQYHCGFCGTKVQVAIAAEQVAAGMALDMSNIDAFLAKLATSLHQAVPQQVRIHASGPHVHGIELTLEADAFVLKREGQHVVCQYKKLVRGIALKTKELPLQQWVQTLADSLARHANVNAQAGQVAAMLGGIR
jgi:hypothetical protein